MNTEHQLRSKLMDLSAQKALNQNKNGTRVMTTAKNAVFIGL